MENHLQMEDALAREMQRKKNDKLAYQKQVEKILIESDEIKLLKNKIFQAQTNKDRVKQIAETQLRRIRQLEDEAQLEEDLIRKKVEEDKIEQKRQAYTKEMRYENKNIIKEQIQEQEILSNEARERYLEEKSIVDKVMQQIIDEDQKNYEKDQQKKKQTYQAMQESLAQKAEKIKKEKELEKLENEKYKQFYQKKEEQQNAIKEKKRLQDEEKERLFERLRLEEEKRRMDDEELIQLRLELQQEEFDKKERDKEKEERIKRERQKKEMQNFEKEQREEKERIKFQAQRDELEFRKKMMQKFAEEDKLEQLSNQRRRQKEIEHKNEVERLWKEKLMMYQMEQQQELQQQRKLDDYESWKQVVIREEKQRLLNEYLKDLEAYMPKGLLTTQDDKELLTGAKETKMVGFSKNFQM